MIVYFTPPKVFELTQQSYSIIYSESYFELVKLLPEIGIADEIPRIDMLKKHPFISKNRYTEVTCYYVYFGLGYNYQDPAQVKASYKFLENSGAIERSLDDILPPEGWYPTK